MEKFKAVVSKVDCPDHIAVECLKNNLHLKSQLRADLYRHPTRSLSDAIARSHNFIRMEEDTKAKIAREAASKQASQRTNDTRPSLDNTPLVASLTPRRDTSVRSTKANPQTLRPQSERRDGTIGTATWPKTLPNLLNQRARSPLSPTNGVCTIRLTHMTPRSAKSSTDITWSRSPVGKSRLSFSAKAEDQQKPELEQEQREEG